MRWLLYILMAFIAAGCSCSGTKTEVLDKAQRLLTDDPTAALQQLNAVDVSQMDDSATMARWALLYTEALVANRLTAPTDTIINIAIDYYGAHNRRDELNKASRLKALIGNTGNRDALATALYLQKEKEFMLYKERSRRERAVTVAGAVILAAIGVILWMRQRLQLQAAQNERLMAEASGLKCRIERTTNDMGRLENMLQQSLKDRFTLIDNLCQTYYETQGTKVERKAISDKVKSEIEAVRTDALPDMERAVNHCCNRLLARLKEKFPEIKPEDYRLAVYLASGLSVRTICLLMDKPTDVIYKRKSRLKQRITAKTGAGDTDLLRIFGN